MKSYKYPIEGVYNMHLQLPYHKLAVLQLLHHFNVFIKEPQYDEISSLNQHLSLYSCNQRSSTISPTGWSRAGGTTATRGKD